MNLIHPPNKRWTPEVVAQLNAKRQAGATYAQLGKEYGVSASSIYLAITKEKRRVAKEQILKQARSNARDNAMRARSIYNTQHEPGSGSAPTPAPNTIPEPHASTPKIPLMQASIERTKQVIAARQATKSTEYEHFLRSVEEELRLKAEKRRKKELKVRIRQTA